MAEQALYLTNWKSWLMMQLKIKIARFGSITFTLFLSLMLAACLQHEVKVPQKQELVERWPPEFPESPDYKTEPLDIVEPLRPIISERSIYFESNEYAINPDYQSLIEAHANYLKQHLGVSIFLQGNADERGSRKYNLNLARMRVNNVKQALMMHGVREVQIEIINFGKEKPVALGHNKAAWSKNRRVDLVYQNE